MRRLRLLERQMLRKEGTFRPDNTHQLSLFAAMSHPVVAALAAVDVGALTPEAALAELRRLKALSRS